MLREIVMLRAYNTGVDLRPYYDLFVDLIQFFRNIPITDT